MSAVTFGMQLVGLLLIGMRIGMAISPRWRRGEPKQKMWGLVMWDYSQHPIPMVAQYDPPSRGWFCFPEGRICMAEECEYIPLPAHHRGSTEWYTHPHLLPAKLEDEK